MSRMQRGEKKCCKGFSETKARKINNCIRRAQLETKEPGGLREENESEERLTRKSRSRPAHTTDRKILRDLRQMDGGKEENSKI